MESIKIKDAVSFHNPCQEEITILGGRQELKDHELKKLAEQFGVASYRTYTAEIWSGSKKGEFIYRHYTLAYGPKSHFFDKSCLN